MPKTITFIALILTISHSHSVDSHVYGETCYNENEFMLVNKQILANLDTIVKQIEYVLYTAWIYEKTVIGVLVFFICLLARYVPELLRTTIYYYRMIRYRIWLCLKHHFPAVN